MAGSRRRRFPVRRSWVNQVRRTKRGAKLAIYSSSDGSLEHPVKVVVIGGDAGSGGDGSPVRVPVFRGSDRIPKSSDNIGDGGPNSTPVPKMCDGGGSPKEPVKLGAGGGGRSKEAVKLGPGGSGGSPERAINIGRSRLRVDSLGQFYVLDSEDEGSDMQAGLFAPDSEEEDGGGYGGRQQLRRRARLPGGGDVGEGYSRG